MFARRSVPLAGGGADGDSGGEAHEAEDDRNSASSHVLLPSPCRKPVATAPTAPTPKHELADIRYPGVSIRVGSATLTRRVGRGDKLWRRASGCNSTRLRGLQDVSDRLVVGGGGRVGCELCASDFCASCRLAIFLWHLHMAPPAIGAINRPRCRFRCARGRAALESTFPQCRRRAGVRVSNCGGPQAQAGSARRDKVRRKAEDRCPFFSSRSGALLQGSSASPHAVATARLPPCVAK